MHRLGGLLRVDPAESRVHRTTLHGTPGIDATSGATQMKPPAARVDRLEDVVSEFAPHESHPRGRQTGPKADARRVVSLPDSNRCRAAQLWRRDSRRLRRRCDEIGQGVLVEMLKKLPQCAVDDSGESAMPI